MDRIKTGIPGFDDLIAGGLVPSSVNLLSGGAGTGKSIFSMQFLYNGAKQYDERGIYISTEESVADLHSDVIDFGMDFNEVSDKIQFYYFPPYEINNFTQKLAHILETFKPRRIVIDSVSSLISALEDDFERRKEIFQLVKVLKEMHVTCLLVSENPGAKADEGFSRFGVEEFLSDSVTLLNLESLGGNYSRTLTVRKMRKTKHNEEVHPLEISSKGIIVHSLQ